MPGPLTDYGPYTPSHCSVCGEPIPKVEDPSRTVRKYARNLNYMKHLEKYHPRYYKWSKRWTNSLYLPVIPFLPLAIVSISSKSVSLLLIALAVLGTPYVPLLFYRWKKVREFRETWSKEGQA